MARRFVNWSREHASTPSAWERPRDDGEVADVLVRARRQGRRVRPIGSGHSWSPIAVPDDVCIDLSRLSAVRAIDAHAGTVRVAAGARLFEISRALDRAGLAMPILGSISAQTIAGAISTGTHGSSLVHGNLASLVTELTLVTPKGEVLRLDERDPRFFAARVSMGALGVVTEVRLRTAPAFTLLGEIEALRIGEVADRLEDIARSSEFVKVWWLPGAPKATVFRYVRTEARARDQRLTRAIDEHVVNKHVFRLALATVRTFPSLTLPLNRAVAASYVERPSVPLRSDLAFNVPMPPRHHETEYAFGLADAARMIHDTARLLREERLRVTFPFEIRFVRGDDAWMSPAYGRDTVQLGAYAADSPDKPRFFEAFEAASTVLGGRPHWGKTTRADASYVSRVYPRFADFVALARELDPDGTMRNAFLDRVLG